MGASDEYLTVKGSGGAETRVKGSRFIASFAPAGTEEAAREFVRQIARRYHDASHHCFAYRAGHGRELMARCSDAGEPSGTAGRPILEAIMAAGLSDVVVVVTRYFGGVKLGTGGLARAYRECAGKALDSVEPARKVLTRRCRLRFPYELTREVGMIIDQHRVGILDQEYGEDVALSVAVRRSEAEALKEALRTAGRGRIEVEMD